MDNEPNHLKPGDEIETLDLEKLQELFNLLHLVQEIIVGGKLTALRVKLEELR